MKILFTGSSSFTGFWFIKALVEGGHEVVATFSGAAQGYSGLRGERTRGVRALCRTQFGTPFGSDRFLALAAGERWDLLCHHAAEVTDYKSPEFDALRAAAANTRNIRGVCTALCDSGCGRIVLTGSYFEQGEGAGSGDLPAFSPYGVSKGITWDIFRYYAREAGLRLGKFVIPNPFGPLEEPRFTAYLVRSWREGETPTVTTPNYLRDNIHVSLLALAYEWFARSLPQGAGGCRRFNPSGYAESQGSFALRLAKEMQQRLGVACPLSLAVQKEFSEPRERINTEPVADRFPQWKEEGAWDDLAAFYRSCREKTTENT